MPDYTPHPASYRDPSGFVFRRDGLYYRQVHRCYADHYELMMRSGTYGTLTKNGLLVAHTEIDDDLTGHPQRYKILLPEQIPFISYPDEWSPSQLKDAALITLQVLHTALDHGMILKDATPLNIQFRNGKPIFIDTLSFEKYDPSLPWVAYRQFCECFLFPLYLQHYLRTGTHVLSGAYPEGISAAQTAILLPWKSRLRLGVWLHVLLLSRIRKDIPSGNHHLTFSKDKLLHLTRNLRHILEHLNTGAQSSSGWSHYYGETILSPAYLASKEQLFRLFISEIDFTSTLDLGANDGYFSKILAETGAPVIAIDSDWPCIESLYRYTREHMGKGDILPLCIDIANPTPARGFANTERASFTDRLNVDLVTALALLHHLALGRNIPLYRIAAWLSTITRAWLILEFIPLTDPKAMDIVRHRQPPPDYSIEALENAFNLYFTIVKQSPIPGTERVLYLMRKNPSL